MKIFYSQPDEKGDISEVYVNAVHEKEFVARDEHGRTWLQYRDNKWKTNGIPHSNELSKTATRIESDREESWKTKTL